MFYILYALAAILAVLKIVGTVTLSWWIIIAIAAVPLAITIGIFVAAFLFALWAETR